MWTVDWCRTITFSTVKHDNNINIYSYSHPFSKVCVSCLNCCCFCCCCCVSYCISVQCLWTSSVYMLPIKSVLSAVCEGYTCFLKPGFRVTPSWRLKKLFKVSALSFHAGTAGDRLEGPCFLLPLRTGVVYRLPRKLSSRAVARRGSADWDSCMVHAWWCPITFSFCSWRILEQLVSGTLCGPTTWPSRSLIYVP